VDLWKLGPIYNITGQVGTKNNEVYLMQVVKYRRTGLATRYPSSMAAPIARYAARKIGSAAMRAIPIVGNAMAAYDVARGAYKAGRRLFSRGTQTGARSSGRAAATKYATKGKYAGRFRRRKVRRDKTDKYRNYGFCNTTEITGTVSDPDCVYIGHSTTSGHRILTVFLQAALRKLFRHVGYTCTNITDPLLGYHPNSDGWRLILSVKEVTTGVITDVTYDTAASDSIFRIVGDTVNGIAPAWPNLYNFWVNYIQNGPPTGATQQPTRLSLYQRDGNVANFYHFMGDIYFPNERINLHVRSELKIQNRTLSTSGSGDAEDVSNNPLIGKSYQFSSANPRLRVENCDIIGSMLDATGVITRRAAEFPAATSVLMREPPSPKIFWNVVKSGKAAIGPGNIKKDLLTYTVSMAVYDFFQKLDWRPFSATVATAISMKGLGKSALFALEDLINVNLAQNISIAYEVNRQEMCYLTTRKTSPSQGLFAQNQQSSNPA